MDAGYPHDVSRWRGVPAGIDAAMQWTDGKRVVFARVCPRHSSVPIPANGWTSFPPAGRTYFFKHELFWRFDDALVRIDGRFPLMAAPYWLACPEHE